MKLSKRILIQIKFKLKNEKNLLLVCTIARIWPMFCDILLDPQQKMVPGMHFLIFIILNPNNPFPFI